MAAPATTLPAPDTSAPQAAAPAAPLWYQPGVADLVFLFVAVLAVRGARQSMLDDPGLGWHLRNIDAMLAAGGWLTHDPFTEPGPNGPRPWKTNQWLGEVPLWLGEQVAGREGVAAVAALVLALMLRCLYGMLLRDGLPWPLAVLWTALAALGTSCSWAARPNVFSLFFVMLTARACEQFHQGRLSRKQTLWLVPLFALWANVHGGFVAGFTLLGTTLLVEVGLAVLSPSPQRRSEARQRAAWLALLTGWAFLATLCNPYGLSLYRWVFQLLGEPYFMELHHEWRSPDFHGGGAMRFELLMVLFPALLAVSARRPNLVELALALVWLHLALTGFRYVALWVVVTVPLLARCSAAIPWLNERLRTFGLTAAPGSLFAARPAPASWVSPLVIAAALLGWARTAQGQFARHKPEIIAAPALDEFLRLHAEWRSRNGRRPVIFHSYDWGGYLTWHGWPEVRNWIDDRNEVQGKERIQEYFSVLNTDPGWQEKLDRAGVELICVESGAPLAYRLTESPGWAERYRDHYAIIFERDGGKPR
jgi:hypothetical protein